MQQQPALAVFLRRPATCPRLTANIHHRRTSARHHFPKEAIEEKSNESQKMENEEVNY
jgi:hypothetical protein